MGHDQYGLGSSHYAWSAGMDASFLDPLVIKPHTGSSGTRGARVNFGAAGDATTAADQSAEIVRVNFPRLKTRRPSADETGGREFLGINAPWKRFMKGRYRRAWDSIQGIASDYGVHVWAVPKGKVTWILFQEKGGDSFGSVEDEADALLEFDEFDEFDEFWDEDEDYGRQYLGAEYHELEEASPGDLGGLVARSGHSGLRGGRPSFGAAMSVNVGPHGMTAEGVDERMGTFFLGVGTIMVLGRGLNLW